MEIVRYKKEKIKKTLTLNYFEYLWMEHFKVFLQSGGIFLYNCLLIDLALAPGDFLVELWNEDLDGVKLVANIGEIDLWFLHLWCRAGG